MHFEIKKFFFVTKFSNKILKKKNSNIGRFLYLKLRNQIQKKHNDKTEKLALFFQALVYSFKKKI